MKHYLEAVAHVFKAIGVFVSEPLIKFFGSAQAHAFAGAALALLETELGKIAMAAVEQANALNSGEEKHGAAFANIVATAKSAGIEAKTSIVNMLIELAVQALKGSFSAIPPK